MHNNALIDDYGIKWDISALRITKFALHIEINY